MILLAYAVALVVSAPCSAASPLEAGAQAQCSGLLVPAGQAVKAVECMTVSLPSCSNNLDTTERKAVIEHTAFTAQISAQVRARSGRTL